MDTILDTMHAAVASLKFWNRILLALVGICFFMILMGAKSVPGVLRAESIQLVTSSGDVRAELAIRDGNPGLYLRDEFGVDRIAMFHESDGTGLHIMDTDGITRIGVVQFAHGGGGVALHGPKSKGAAVLYLKQEGSLRFFDQDGRITNQVTASELTKTE